MMNHDVPPLLVVPATSETGNYSNKEINVSPVYIKLDGGILFLLVELPTLMRIKTCFIEEAFRRS